MRTLSLDLRERILASYDHEEGTREEIADRFRVSLGMVKKLLQQRRRTGHIGPRHHFSGRKPMIVDSPSAPVAGAPEPQAGPDLEGTAPGCGTALLAAGHPLRLGEDGADI